MMKFTEQEAAALVGRRFVATAGYSGVPPGTIGTVVRVAGDDEESDRENQRSCEFGGCHAFGAKGTAIFKWPTGDPWYCAPHFLEIASWNEAVGDGGLSPQDREELMPLVLAAARRYEHWKHAADQFERDIEKKPITKERTA